MTAGPEPTRGPAAESGADRLVLALSGGVGGAKMVDGLNRLLAPGRLIAIANTGDDFEHLGLHISPDLDTLMYTLADLHDPVRGWGRRDETWEFMSALEALGGPAWFQLGDRDLATHVERTRHLRRGETLSAVTRRLCQRLGISTVLRPMTDDPVRTRLLTDRGWLDFQDYFVRLRCGPAVRKIVFEGADRASPQADFLAALSDPDLRAVIVCPSNPFISVDPILAVPGVREALGRCRAPVVAVSPIIAGAAVKGPTAKMMDEFGLRPCAAAVAKRYGGLIDGFVLDERDAASDGDFHVPVAITDTLMRGVDDRIRVARASLELADRLSSKIEQR